MKTSFQHLALFRELKIILELLLYAQETKIDVNGIVVTFMPG